MTIQGYMAGYMATRKYWEVAGLVLLLSIGFLGNLVTTAIDHARVGTEFAVWEIAVWEGTSHVATGLLLPVLLWVDGRFSLTRETWRRSLAAHLLFTPAWSFAHLALMVWGRIVLYQWIGDNRPYHLDGWWSQFGYEYLKDFRSYFQILAIVYLYRFVLRRLQGEAGYVAEGAEDKAEVEVTDRFLIKKLGREFLVRAGDIEWIESNGNYVNLHVGGRVYPLRETMTGITERLTILGFRRVHRSAIVNLDRVAEIVPFDTGDGEARLHSGVTVPVSRRYRKVLREQLG